LYEQIKIDKITGLKYNSQNRLLSPMAEGAEH